MATAHTSETPGDGDLDNGAAITTGNKLSVASDRTAYALYFWVPATNSGTYTVGLYEVTNDDDPGAPAGTLLVSASVGSGSVTADGFATVPITPTAVLSSKLYAVAVHSSSGRFVRTAGALNAAGITNAGITITQSGTAFLDGVVRNGTFHEGAALAYPDTIFGQPDYFTGIDDETDGLTGGLAGTLPALTGALTGVESFAGTFDATLPALTGELAAVESMSGALVGTLPALVGELAGTMSQPVTGALDASLPALTGALVAAAPEPAVPTGSWYGLLAIVREAEQLRAEDEATAPTADPGGWPLSTGPRGELFSQWDGWRPDM